MSCKWYIISALSGNELKIAQAIREAVVERGLSDKFQDVIVPMEQLSKMKRGKKVEIERRVYPGYILINMELDENTLSLLKSIPKLNGILGGQRTPHEVSEEEVRRMLSKAKEMAESRSLISEFDLGDTVRIVDGSFETFTGIVDEVDSERSMLKVLIKVFERETPMELGFHQVEKVKTE